jgi:hypothetical protein
MGMLGGDYIVMGTSEWTQTGEDGVVFNEGEKVYLKGFIGLNRDVLNPVTWRNFQLRLASLNTRIFPPWQRASVSISVLDSYNAMLAYALAVKFVFSFFSSFFSRFCFVFLPPFLSFLFGSPVITAFSSALCRVEI